MRPCDEIGSIDQRIWMMRSAPKLRSVTAKTMFAVENREEVLAFASHLVTLYANHTKLLRGCPPAARVAYSLKPKRGRYGEEGKEEESQEEEEVVFASARAE